VPRVESCSDRDEAERAEAHDLIRELRYPQASPLAASRAARKRAGGRSHAVRTVGSA
jgi:hypothetical protein